ncbi:MAG: alpha/beta fold hydrolase [Pseudomonadota bacterium]
MIRRLLRQTILKRIYQPDRLPTLTGHYRGAGFERIEVQTSDGLALSGLRSYPLETAVRGSILYFHGNGGCAANRANLVGPLVAHGWDVIVADYRGYGDNEGVPSEVGLMEDAAAFMSYARESSSAPLIVFGHSLGGAIAISLLASDADNVVGLLTLGTFASLALRSPAWVRDYLPESYDAIGKAMDVKVPWIIAHERGDEVTSAQHAMMLHHASGTSGRVQLSLLEGGSHALDAQKLIPLLDNLLAKKALS